MEKFNDLLEELNNQKIIQHAGDWAENLTEEVWEGHIKDNFELIKEGLEPDPHRHYELSIMVIKIYDKLMGIELVSNLFSEAQGFEDCYHTMRFFEMEEFTTTSFREVTK